MGAVNTLSKAQIAELLAESARRFAEIRDRFAEHQLGDVLDFGDGPVIVMLRSFGKDADVDEVLAGTAVPITIVATEDGGQFINAWHEGPSEIDSWIRYERWTVDGRIAHGYIDRESRKLVQVG